MLRALSLLVGSFLLLGASNCQPTYQTPALTLNRCFDQPWLPSCGGR